MAPTLPDVRGLLRRLFHPSVPRRRARAAPPADALAIEYAPRPDGRPDPGEVVWTWVPFEDDPRQGKDRPVVVIGRYGRRDLAVLPLTSQDRSDRRAVVALGAGPWDAQHRPSWVRVDRLLRVPPTKVRREGGRLDRDRFDRVVAAFRAQVP